MTSSRSDTQRIRDLERENAELKERAEMLLQDAWDSEATMHTALASKRDLEREVERLKAEWRGVEPKARRIATLWRNDALEAAADIADRYGELLIRDDILALLTPIDAAMAKDPQP